MVEPGLTDADRNRLADMAANGVHAYTNSSRDDTSADGIPVTCHRCGHEWRYTGRRKVATCSQCRSNTALDDTDGRGFTPQMCNAIREAARDGLTYRQIADSFSFLTSKAAAYRHATGKCGHGGDPVESKRPPGPPNQVTATECQDLRERYGAGRSQYAIAKATGWHQKTVWFHVSEACSHDHGR